MIQKYDVVRLRSRLDLSQEKFAEKLFRLLRNGRQVGISPVVYPCVP